MDDDNCRFKDGKECAKNIINVDSGNDSKENVSHNTSDSDDGLVFNNFTN